MVVLVGVSGHEVGEVLTGPVVVGDVAVLVLVDHGVVIVCRRHASPPSWIRAREKVRQAAIAI
jgi:hypothetical protein